MTATGKRPVSRTRVVVTAVAALLTLIFSAGYAVRYSWSPRMLETASGADAVAISPDGRTLYVAEGGRWLVPYNLATGRPGRRVDLNGKAVKLLVSPDGRTLAAMVDVEAESGDGVTQYDIIRIAVRAGTESRLDSFTQVPGAGGVDLALSRDGRTLYALEGAAPNEIARPFNLATGRHGKPIRVARDTTSIALSPDGRTLYTAFGNDDMPDGTHPSVTPYDTRTGKAGKTLPFDRELAVADNFLDPADLIPSADGRTLYVTADYYNGTQMTPPGPVYLYRIDTATGKTARSQITSDDDSDLCDLAALSRDQRTLYVMADHAGVLPVHTGSLRPAAPLKTSSAEAEAANRDMVMTPDGRTLYVADQKGVAVLSVSP